jgi:hypothetical protein
MHAHDWLLFRRSLITFAVLAVMALGIVVGTDEAGSTTGMRVARFVALSPALSVLAQLFTLAQSEARGELGALRALGASPLRVARGPLLAGLAVGVAAMLTLASRSADVTSLFPAVSTPGSWVNTDLGLRDLATGVTVTPSGDVVFPAVPVAGLQSAAPDRFAALACLGPISLAAAFWGATPLGLPGRVAVAALTAFVAIVLLHATAAGVIPALWLAVAALPLVAQSAVGWGRRRLA